MKTTRKNKTEKRTDQYLFNTKQRHSQSLGILTVNDIEIGYMNVCEIVFHEQIETNFIFQQ
jgi:hypothetical protein